MKFRLSWIFQFGDAGWSEQWYRDADTPQLAANVSDFCWQEYMYPRADGCLLRAIRAAAVSNPRMTFLRIMNKGVSVAQADKALGGEPAGVALMVRIDAADFTHRTAMFRGMNDLDVARNVQGQPIWNAAILQDVNALGAGLASMGAQIQVLTRASVANPERPITQLAQGSTGPETTAIQYTGAPIPLGSRVIIHGLSRQLFPGLQGPLPLIAATDDAIFVPVRWRQPTANVAGNGARVRIVSYEYKAVQGMQPEDVRTRKVGRPLLGYRGRRQALRYRSR